MRETNGMAQNWQWNGQNLSILRHKVVSKRVPRKFVTTARPFSVKCKWSPVSGELQIVSGGDGNYIWECANSCFYQTHQPRYFNKVDSNGFQAFLCEMQVKFQFLVLQIVCGGGENFFFLIFWNVFAIFYDISTGFWHSRWRCPMVGILGKFVGAAIDFGWVCDEWYLDHSKNKNHVCNL